MTLSADSFRELSPVTTARTPINRATLVDAVADPRWDAFVRDHPDAGAYHLAAWSRVLADAYGYSPRYLMLESDGRVEGILPVMSSRGVVTGKRLRSLPALGS